MDIGTGLALLGTAKLVEKLLGPTAQYLGEGLKNWTEKGINNLKNIFTIAIEKVGNRIDDEGAVPSKVLKAILMEGPFCDDYLAAEYFGGVLASSRSATSRDDRGAYLIALLGRLSTYQIRTHYIFYHIVKKLYDGADVNAGMLEERSMMGTYVPIDTYVTAMDFDEQEMVRWRMLLRHATFGLSKEVLIGDFFRFGSKDYLKQYLDNVTSDGIIFFPSSLGLELFFWAYAKSDLDVSSFLQPDNQFELDRRIKITSGFQKVLIKGLRAT